MSYVLFVISNPDSSGEKSLLKHGKRNLQRVNLITKHRMVEIIRDAKCMSLISA